MKKLLCVLLCLLALAVAVSAEEVENPSGTCGEKLLWELDGGTLSVYGEGEMEDFDLMAPWFDYRDQITTVNLTGVTKVGSYAFADYDNLTSVDFGDALTELGQGAFSDCDGLTELYFPATFRTFGEESLTSCDNLTAIHSQGKFPSFKQNCLWQTSAKIYYPVERPWSVELIAQLEDAFHGRVEFLASDGSDPYTPTEETQAPATQPPAVVTEPPVVIVTPPTEETAPVTAPVTQPEPTAAPSTQPVTIPEPTQPAPKEERQGGHGLLIIVVCILVFVALGAVTMKPKPKKRRRSSGSAGKASGEKRPGGKYTRR